MRSTSLFIACNHHSILFSNEHSPSNNHVIDFPATFDVDGSNIVRGNADAGSTRIAFRYAGESCLEDNTAPTYMTRYIKCVIDMLCCSNLNNTQQIFASRLISCVLT